MLNVGPQGIEACQVVLRRGVTSRVALVSDALLRSGQAGASAVWTQRYEGSALDSARAADHLALAGAPQHVLAGLPVSVKDLYQVQGTPTWAGSAALAYKDTGMAGQDAPAVARLRATGAAILGKTHMSELAFSGVGLNPQHGLLVNPVDTARGDCVPGGSSSGAAVSVALGLAVAALGSDTGGSIRIPAALCGLVGFKGSQSRVPTQGMVPLSPAFDTACAITRNVPDAVVLDAVLSAQTLAVTPRPLAGLRYRVPSERLLDDLEPPVAHAFERALKGLARAGVELVRAPMPLLLEIGARNPAPGIAALQAWALHQDLVSSHGHLIDPRILARLRSGGVAPASVLAAALEARQDWIARMEVELAGFDGILCPTVPILAPRIADLQTDERFFEVNALLLRNTFVGNYLDGCSISLPCHRPDEGEEPVGLMVTAPNGQDAQLLSAALSMEALFSETGATHAT